MLKKQHFEIEWRVEYKGGWEIDFLEEVTMRAESALVVSGQILLDEIRQQLSRPGTGIWYYSKKRDGSMHQASRPGDSPAPDTGAYVDSFDYFVETVMGMTKLVLRSSLWYVFGRRLELGGHGGGAYIAPRPHIRPVYERTESKIIKLLGEGGF